MSEIVKFLERLQQARNAFVLGKLPDGFRFNSIDELLLKHGHSFLPARKPKSIPWGSPKECFVNAAQLAMKDHTLTYCEGYAAGIIPVLHAWCVKEGRVIDNTWRKMGTEYFGVAISRTYLIRTLLKQMHYGVLDSWEDGYPILKDDPEKWRVKI